ncbi:MAG: hypothetical protein CVV47_05900 [Spirochaetae bacterium HGW-Spirochaetae-3]|jgi:hypothetical protein|nr:MAG: hypothetical protein CVV47_05900 [Spirochaetae bacterium HGW-Spirochaetae-3]
MKSADSVETASVPDGYKRIALEAIGVSLSVPADWRVLTAARPGGTSYFIGTIPEYLEFDESAVPMYTEFYDEPGSVHGVRIQKIDGSEENVERELAANAPRYPVVSREDFSNGGVTRMIVLMKDDYRGYYLYYGGTPDHRSGLGPVGSILARREHLVYAGPDVDLLVLGQRRFFLAPA